MKSSTILKKARKLIKSGKEDFICIAVEEVSNWDKFAAEKITTFIGKSLHPHYTLGQWVDTQVNYNIYEDQDYDQRIRQTRLNWIDHMIQLYKAKND
jgi:hypothetical protein